MSVQKQELRLTLCSACNSETLSNLTKSHFIRFTKNFLIMREFLDAIRFIPAGGNRVSVGFINETDGKYLFSILNRYLFFSLFSFLHKDFLNLTAPQPRNPATPQSHNLTAPHCCYNVPRFH